MVYDLDPELELLFRQFFSFKKYEIYINLIERHDKSFLNDEIFDYLFNDQNFNSYSYFSKKNINMKKNYTSVEIEEKIKFKLIESNVYYKNLYEITQFFKYDDFWNHEKVVEIDYNISKDFNFLFLKLLEGAFLFCFKDVDNRNLGKYFNIYGWEKYSLLFLCDIYLRRQHLEFYKNELIDFLQDDSNKEVDYFLFASKLYIKNLLYINFNSRFERKVAHYTNVSVVEKIIKKKSRFRLNATNLMNDPTEGKEFFKYLNSIEQSDRELKLSNFYLASFTFNHNSLNQFRLYGRTRSIECSGISLVFNKQFFLNKKGSSNLDRLYRCVYLEPLSGFLQVACRDKFTFIQEEEKYTSLTEGRWTLYNRMINLKNEYLRLLVDLIKYVCSKYDIEKDKISYIFGDTSYLFKNFCFKDEQECRIIRKADINYVKYQGFLNSYLEYEGNIYNSLKNIYIGEASIKLSGYIQKMVLIHNKFVTKPKIKICEHPYRATEYLQDIDP